MEKAHCERHPTFFDSCIACSHAFIDQLNAQRAAPVEPTKIVKDRGVIAHKVLKRPPVVRQKAVPHPKAESRPELLTVKEVAIWLNLREGSVYDWIYERKLSVIKIGQRVRIRRQTIEKMLEDGEIPARAKSA